MPGDTSASSLDAAVLNKVPAGEARMNQTFYVKNVGRGIRIAARAMGCGRISVSRDLEKFFDDEMRALCQRVAAAAKARGVKRIDLKLCREAMPWSSAA